MCVMGNGIDPSIHIPPRKYPDEKYEFNKQWPKQKFNANKSDDILIMQSTGSTSL